MTNEEREWHIDIAKQRYQYLKLTDQQAEKILQYEQERDAAGDAYFSMWEEWDFERSSFRKILTARQWRKYEVLYGNTIARYEQELIDADKEHAHEIAYYREMIGYYETKLLPELTGNYYTAFGWLNWEKNKIRFLKEEYRQYLVKVRKKILVEHFRHNRQFKPKQLETSLIFHQTRYILPDYFSFRQNMDVATKGVDDFIRERLKIIPEETETLLKKIFGDLGAFHETNVKKHYGELKGWHIEVAIKETAEEEKIRHAMTVVLIDNDRYQ